MLSRWESNYKYYKDEINIKAKRMNGGGRKSEIKELEKDIIFWIIHNKKADFKIKYKSIIAYIYTLNDKYKQLSIDVLRQKIKKILNKNHLSIKNKSKIGNPLLSNIKELINNFLYEIIKLRFLLKINDNELNRIINIDENVIYYEKPLLKKCNIKGKTVEIINIDKNKDNRISVLLSVCGDGIKLPPFCIFQGEKEKKLENELKDNYLIKKKLINAYCNKKGWCDVDIFLKWYEQIYLIYEKYIIKKKCILILDKSPLFYNKEIIDLFNKNKTFYIYIPFGLTKYLQPLDLNINNYFKEALIREYILDKNINKYLYNNINEKNLTSKENRLNIIKIINYIWWETNDITKSLIKDSFKKGGITLKDDGSEDEFWNIPNKIIDNFSIYDQIESKINEK